jgi:hypothetical protein
MVKDAPIDDSQYGPRNQTSPALSTRSLAMQSGYLCSSLRVGKYGPSAGVALAPGCQIGYMDHSGCHQSVIFTIRPTRVVTPLPRGVSDWLRGPYRLS